MEVAEFFRLMDEELAKTHCADCEERLLERLESIEDVRSNGIIVYTEVIGCRPCNNRHAFGFTSDYMVPLSDEDARAYIIDKINRVAWCGEPLDGWVLSPPKTDTPPPLPGRAEEDGLVYAYWSRRAKLKDWAERPSERQRLRYAQRGRMKAFKKAAEEAREVAISQEEIERIIRILVADETDNIVQQGYRDGRERCIRRLVRELSALTDAAREGIADAVTQEQREESAEGYRQFIIAQEGGERVRQADQRLRQFMSNNADDGVVGEDMSGREDWEITCYDVMSYVLGRRVEPSAAWELMPEAKTVKGACELCGVEEKEFRERMAKYAALRYPEIEEALRTRLRKRWARSRTLTGMIETGWKELKGIG